MTTDPEAFIEFNTMSEPDPETEEWLRPFRQRILEFQNRDSRQRASRNIGALPVGFKPWWDAHVGDQLSSEARPLRVNVDALVLGALRHSPQVHAIREIVPIEETKIIEADADFDWHAFVESNYDDTSDPVGNTLTTGGSPRFRDNVWSHISGLRRKTSRGGYLEVSQRIGFQDNNSNFFVPSQQGNAQLSISFTQPLLNKAGEAYNQSRTVLAYIDTEIAKDDFSQQLQDHLLKVTRTYWQLYQARAVLLQKRRLYERGDEILQMLEGRRNVDVMQRQILRARAVVATRSAAILRAETSIRNAETDLRTTVNDPKLLSAQRFELLPNEFPNKQHIEINLQVSLLTALKSRPEIAQEIKNVRAASVRLGMAKQDLLPILDFVVGTYVAGLKGESDIMQAFGQQFSTGEPGYSVGLLFEVPLGNRRAKARHERRQREVQQALHQLQATVETALAEVEVAAREAETSYREMLSKQRSMTATEAEVQFFEQRWEYLPGSDRAASFLLEDLLDAQDRLATEEFGFVSAQVNYTFAMVNLKRTMGTLLQYSRVSPVPNDGDEPPSNPPAVPAPKARPQLPSELLTRETAPAAPR